MTNNLQEKCVKNVKIAVISSVSASVRREVAE